MANILNFGDRRKELNHTIRIGAAYDNSNLNDVARYKIQTGNDQTDDSDDTAYYNDVDHNSEEPRHSSDNDRNTDYASNANYVIPTSDNNDNGNNGSGS